jgi:hypothetical protein
MHGDCRHAPGNAGAQCGDARDIHRIRRLGDAPKNDFIDQLGVKPGAGQQRGQRRPRQIGGAERGEFRARFRERRAHAVQNQDAVRVHEDFPWIAAFSLKVPLAAAGR